MEYDALLEQALEALTENPRAGRPRPEIAPSAGVYWLEARKRGVPHLFVYRILEEGRAEIRGLFDGAMQLRRPLARSCHVVTNGDSCPSNSGCKVNPASAR